MSEGLVLVNAMHITASVFINDDEPGLHHDYAAWLEELAPFDASPQRYRHNRTGEDNADAHLKRQVMGREVVVAITGGCPQPRCARRQADLASALRAVAGPELDFGPWERIFYGELFWSRAGRPAPPRHEHSSSTRALRATAGGRSAC